MSADHRSWRLSDKPTSSAGHPPVPRPRSEGSDDTPLRVPPPPPRDGATARPTPVGTDPRQVTLCGCRVDLLSADEAVEIILEAARVRQPVPLGVVSANLDHVHHFGTGGRWHGVLEQSEASDRIRWVTLLDGAPVATRAQRRTGRPWPRLAGSDLIGPLLDGAAAEGLRVGFLGGTPENRDLLRAALKTHRPRLTVSGCWAPGREVLGSVHESRRLASEIRSAGVDLLVVGLGKPRQELWVAEYGHLTGAGTLLAFGAVVDFLAQRVPRAPAWLSAHGLEWSYRLALEPRRLSRRYLLHGPEAYRRLMRSGLSATTPDDLPHVSFVPLGERADIAVVVVTYQSAEVISELITDLRREAGSLRLRVVVVDNASTDETVARARAHPDVVVVEHGRNGGYAAGINLGAQHSGRSRALLVLNPDVRIDDGAVIALWQRLWQPGVGAVVPEIQDSSGRRTNSLRFEPSVLRTLGDALLGDRLPGRPVWSTETDHDPEAYEHAHAVEWATGACVMVRSEVSEGVGPWDEDFFLYSEEVDFLRRVRAAGWSTWYEPTATVRHQGTGSGTSAQLGALLAVNRVRYAHKHHGPVTAEAVRAAAALGELLRSRHADHRVALGYLVHRRPWSGLPRATGPVAPSPDAPQLHDEHRPRTWGSIVVPAHNEGTILGRTIQPLARLVAPDQVQLVVAANGCTDDTAERAADVPGVLVLELAESSKARALNAGDRTADRWPRLYLDADVEITPRAVADVFSTLAAGTVLAARPPFRYDTTGASWPVRAFYRARGRLPGTREHLWGAGVYGLSAMGRQRFTTFPTLTADDLYVDSLFEPHEKAVVETDSVVVHTPSDVRSLLGVLSRTYAGNRELGAVPQVASPPSTTRRTVRDLVRSGRSPRQLLDAVVYASFVVLARRRSRRASTGWSRDESSRYLREAASW